MSEHTRAQLAQNQMMISVMAIIHAIEPFDEYFQVQDKILVVYSRVATHVLRGVGVRVREGE